VGGACAHLSFLFVKPYGRASHRRYGIGDKANLLKTKPTSDSFSGQRDKITPLFKADQDHAVLEVRFDETSFEMSSSSSSSSSSVRKDTLSAS
jgi:hypothetical protein